MARPLRISYPNAFYHVTCRGNDRRAIFRDDHDRTRFLAQLESALEIFSVGLHAYVLMSNHFHLIVETPKANLSEFMRQFNISREQSMGSRLALRQMYARRRGPESAGRQGRQSKD
jgi:putative transposase